MNTIKGMCFSLCLMLSIPLMAQEASKNSFGLSLGYGKSAMIQPDLIGGASYHLDQGLSVGFNYSYKISKRVSFESGISWYNNNLTVTPNLPPQEDNSPREYNFNLLYLPLFLRLDVSKHVYLNGGFLADFDINKTKQTNSQSGLGTGVGFGFSFSATKKIVIELNPFLNLHGMILRDRENYPKRVLDSGLRLVLRTK